MEIEILVNGQTEILNSNQGSEVYVQDLIVQQALQDKRIAVELNKKIVSGSQFTQTKLCSGDRVEIVTAIGGG